VFHRVGVALPPDWFSRIYLDAAPARPIPLAAVFPFIDGFLSAAEAAWRRGDPGRLRSDVFTMADPAGGEIDLVASAITIDHRYFLILEASADAGERRRTLQLAREQVLSHEDHVRETGALMAPVNAALKLARQLASENSPPPDEQRRLGSEIADELARLATSIETLAPLPKGVARGRR
jgi:hypothetical protein